MWALKERSPTTIQSLTKRMETKQNQRGQGETKFNPQITQVGKSEISKHRSESFMCVLKLGDLTERYNPVK